MCPFLEFTSNFWKFKRNRIFAFFQLSPKHSQSITFYYYDNKIALNCERWLQASLICAKPQNSDFKSKSKLLENKE